MGYDLHITRRESWLDEGNDITFAEFIELMKCDPEFTYPSPNGIDYADWRDSETGCESWLRWWKGHIETKNPDPEIINKMIVIARMLGAKVQGDDGKVYLPATEIKKDQTKPLDTFPDNDPGAIGFADWPLGKQLATAFLIGLILLILKILIFGR